VAIEKAEDDRPKIALRGLEVEAMRGAGNEEQVVAGGKPAFASAEEKSST